tara:strand:+ start:852 stop:974 length:123 start_codon:yes stop_codon:yes gene_type:complete
MNKELILVLTVFTLYSLYVGIVDLLVDSISLPLFFLSIVM